MSSFTSSHLLILGCLAAAAVAQQAPSPSTAATDAGQPVLSSAPSLPSTKPADANSAGSSTNSTSLSTAHRSRQTSAALAGISFEAPPAEKKKQQQQEEAAAEEEVDLREVDKPRNAIIRLPKYVIQGERPPVFTDPEINTKKGMAALAVKRYLSSVQQGLNQYHLPGILGGLSNSDIAMQMYRDDERVKNQQDYSDKLSLFRQVGDKDAAAMQKEATNTFKQNGSFSDPGTRNLPESSSPRIMREGDW